MQGCDSIVYIWGWQSDLVPRPHPLKFKFKVQSSGPGMRSILLFSLCVDTGRGCGGKYFVTSATVSLSHCSNSRNIMAPFGRHEFQFMLPMFLIPWTALKKGFDCLIQFWSRSQTLLLRTYTWLPHVWPRLLHFLERGLGARLVHTKVTFKLR